MVSEPAYRRERRQPRQAPVYRSAYQIMANEDFAKVLSNVLLELASSEKSKQATASAAVAVLLTQAPEGQILSPSVVPAVLPLLSSDSPLIQVSVVSFDQHEAT